MVVPRSIRIITISSKHFFRSIIYHMFKSPLGIIPKKTIYTNSEFSMESGVDGPAYQLCFYLHIWNTAFNDFAFSLVCGPAPLTFITAKYNSTVISIGITTIGNIATTSFGKCVKDILELLVIGCIFYNCDSHSNI